MDNLSKEIMIEEKGIVSDKYATALNKVKFANEIRHGLGKKLKSKPNEVKILKKSRLDRFLIFLKNFFNKF